MNKRLKYGLIGLVGLSSLYLGNLGANVLFYNSRTKVINAMEQDIKDYRAIVNISRKLESLNRNLAKLTGERIEIEIEETKINNLELKINKYELHLKNYKLQTDQKLKRAFNPLLYFKKD